MSSKAVAVVTGASRGIGEATALAFAKAGHHVTIVARTGDALQKLAKRIEAIGSEVLICTGDLTDLDFARSAIDQTVKRWGRIDVLVNNAAWREIASMRKISVESWEKTIRICLTTPAFMSRWAAETMEMQKRGVIFNISSIMSQQVAGSSPSYIVCKGALDSLTYELASLYGPSGIRVIAINPGAIDTEMSRDVAPDMEDAKRDLERHSKEMIMLGRWGQPGEIAALMVALAGDAGSYVTAARIVVDGGWSHEHFPLSLKRQQWPGEFQ